MVTEPCILNMGWSDPLTKSNDMMQTIRTISMQDLIKTWGSFTSSVSWHHKSLYDNVILRNCATKISNHDTLVRCQMHCRNRFSDMKYQKIQAEVWQTSVSLRLNPACKIPCLTEWQGCDCAPPPAVLRRIWAPGFIVAFSSGTRKVDGRHQEKPFTADRNISMPLMHKRSTSSPNLVIHFHPRI